ncbi:hypothetical protein AB0F91_45845 [Amycolatopsis sp. NPDC023774]
MGASDLPASTAPPGGELGQLRDRVAELDQLRSVDVDRMHLLAALAAGRA